MKFIYFIQILKKKIKKKNINSILFADSYGGIHHFFYMLEKLLNNQDRFLIVCANQEIYDFIKKIEIIKKFKIDVVFYKYKDNLLFSFIKIIPLLFLRPIFPKINFFYSYKLAIDPIRFLIINLLFGKKSKIVIKDQFIKFYIFKHTFLLKRLILSAINKFTPVKLFLYYHRDLSTGLFPSINKNLNKNINKTYTWKNINNYFFGIKLKKIKGSLIIIDDTISLLSKLNQINIKKDKKIISQKINKFILDKKIRYIYSKDHPTSNRSNYLSSLIKGKKINKLREKIPLEVYIDQFQYCIFSNTSCFYYKKKIKLYNISKLIKFNTKINKKNYFYLLKKTSKNNYNKIFFFKN